MLKLGTLAILVNLSIASAGVLNHNSSTGVQCQSICAKYNYREYYCKNNGNWRTCSPYEGVTYKGETCLNQCSTYGSSYNWCSTATSWDYCGLVQASDTPVRHFTRYGSICSDACDKINKGSYYCNTYGDNSWEYCSPSIDHDIYGNECSFNGDEGFCGFHGEYYTWCYKKNGGWGYCGLIDDCETSFRQKRAISIDDIVDKKIDDGNRRETRWVKAGRSEKIAQCSRQQRIQAGALLGDYFTSSTTNSRPSAGTVARSDDGTLRLDVQGSFNRDGIRYINYQIQVNENRHGGKSTTIAGAALPDGTDVITPRYIRRAFDLSMDHGVFILLQTMPLYCQQRNYG